LGGDATGLGDGAGAAVGRWVATGDTVLTGWVRGGLGLRFSADHTSFVAMRDPILVVPGAGGAGAGSPERIAYPVVLDAKTGADQLSNSWLLAYAYTPPNEGREKRYLVFHEVEVTLADGPVTPAQAGVLLARWYDPKRHDHWSTTAPVPGNYSNYRLEAKSGYLMTVAPAAAAAVELEECVSMRPRHPDHMIAEKGFCAAHQYELLRTAGWVFGAPNQHTVPLYRCYAAAEQSHFASNDPECEKLGTMERLLGYVLER
jgi:hypothetical protein